MASTTVVAQSFLLGDLAKARGKLGPAYSHATPAQIGVAAGIVGNPANYSKQLESAIICVDDRLHRRASRLAGGALCPALMRNFLYRGTLLSQDLRELKKQGFPFPLWFHEDCGALGLAPTLIPDELSDVNAEGYKLLGRLGVTVPMPIRYRIARWATTVNPRYFDIEKALKVADGVDKVHGSHNAAFAVIDTRDGESFIGGPELSDATGGLLAFVCTPWVAIRSARKMAVPRSDQEAAAALALVFTAQVFLTLGGPDLRVALR